MTGSMVVGLTGGIGSGKSAVSRAFSALGVELVDTDALAHELSAPGTEGFAAIRAAFGPQVVLPSGEIDRGWLRRRVFADPAMRTTLETVLHPLIVDEARRRIAHWRGAYGIVVVPLLLERGGLAGSVDRVLVVDCPEAEQVRRVVERSGLSEPEVRAIMATQLDRAQRTARADDVLDNSGPLKKTLAQVEALDRRYRQLARELRRPD
ncbi:MAG TPA: dephospho-CoA kinase [Casimicrobiaceae bacterium]|nr:dephospho-CoA kinase [Casimicrobiaceae bacterium]